MNQDLSAGLGAGLMNLGSMWSQFLMKRMDAEWEDERADKRAQAAARAELEKKKALDEYLAGQPAGMAPAVTEGPDGKKQYMMQPINSIGAPVGELKPMAPHQRTAYDIAETKRRQDEALNQLTLQGKQKDIESKDARIETDKTRAALNRARTEEVGKTGVGSPRNGTASDKSITSAVDHINRLVPSMSTRDAEDTAKQLSELLVKYRQGADPQLIEQMVTIAMADADLKASQGRARAKEEAAKKKAEEELKAAQK